MRKTLSAGITAALAMLPAALSAQAWHDPRGHRLVPASEWRQATDPDAARGRSHCAAGPAASLLGAIAGGLAGDAPLGRGSNRRIDKATPSTPSRTDDRDC